MCSLGRDGIGKSVCEVAMRIDDGNPIGKGRY
jgi:hypothetical protein